MDLSKYKNEIILKAKIPIIFIDFTTQDILDDPVIAGDGHTYSRESICMWFSVCESQNSPYTSPLTGKEIDTTLIPNIKINQLLTDLKDDICPYRRKSFTSQNPLTSMSAIQLRAVNETLSLHKFRTIFQYIDDLPPSVSSCLVDLLPVQWQVQICTHQ
jgi:hypothetical protein